MKPSAFECDGTCPGDELGDCSHGDKPKPGTDRALFPQIVTGIPIPIPMILACPGCHQRHVDAGEFAVKPHHTHACQFCGMVWRPALVATVGVQFLPGFKDEVRKPTNPVKACGVMRSDAGASCQRSLGHQGYHRGQDGKFYLSGVGEFPLRPYFVNPLDLPCPQVGRDGRHNSYRMRYEEICRACGARRPVGNKPSRRNIPRVPR